MQRRKFLIGAGSAAVGASALVGSGAYSAMTASRDANINVVNDGSGLVALRSGTLSDVVRESDGQLMVDFTADGNAGGVNVNSRYQVGQFDYQPPGEVDPLQDEAFGGWGNPYQDAAFFIENQDSTAHNVSLTYTITGSIDGSQIYFQLQDEDDYNSGDVTDEILIPNVAGRGNTASVTLDSGEKVGVSFQVDTGDGDPGSGSVTDGSTAENLSGTLTVSSE
jgi:hypothetical protein